MIKKCLIGLGIYTVLAVATVFGLIYYHNYNENCDSLLKTNNAIKTKPSNLDGCYNENSLKINEEKVIYNGVEFDLVSISGLKDKTIQNKINKEIEQTVHSAIDRTDNCSYAWCGETANFSNVLSICINAYSYDGEGDSVYEYLNYNLTNGEKLTFKDLFVDNANYARIISQSLFEQKAKNQYWDNVDAWYANSNVETMYPNNDIVSIDEDSLYNETVSYLKNLDNLEFGFTANSVTFGNDLSADSSYCFLKFIDIKDEVNIYDKYKTSFSIFEDDKIGVKNIFNFSDYNANGENVYLGYVANNVFVDFNYDDGKMYISSEQVMPEEYKAAFQNKVDLELKEFDKVVKEAKADSKNFYAIFESFESDIYDQYNNGLSTFDMSDAYITTKYYTVYKVPNDYADEYKEKIRDAYQNKFFSSDTWKVLDYNYDKEGNLIEDEFMTRIQESKYYNYKTGEEYKDIEDFFHDDFDYKDYAFQVLLERLNFPECEESYEEIQALFDNAEFTLDNYGFQIDIEGHDDIWCHVAWSDYYKSVLKMFDSEGEEY